MKTCRIIYFIACVLAIGCIIIKHFRKGKIQGEVIDTPKEVKNGNDDLKFTLESVNSWLNNCDQKAGILLTVVGVAITVIMTSDFLKYIRSYIFAPFMAYCLGNSDLSFSWSRFTVFGLLVIAMAILITCCIYLFRAIRANLVDEKTYKENPNLVKTSYIYYKSISQMNYDDFEKGGAKFEEDLKSQIYINSKIATEKFKNYNEGLFWFELLLLDAVMLLVAIMFVQ